MVIAQNPDVLVLWDIDHTLIETRGVGGAAFAAAFEQVVHQPLLQMPQVTGRTEPDIYRATAALHAVDDPPAFEVFAEALATAYRERQTDLALTGRIMPGAEEALGQLASLTTVRQSVLTGNTRTVAEIKLATFGLDSHLDLTVGAFGDDDRHRPTLVSIAQARAKTAFGQTFCERNTVLVGDSPGDVATAVEGGARIIAVAAGGSPATTLTGAELILDDLTDIAALMRAVRSLSRP
ncbi:HAD hydrolase-like protein [Nocardia sp. NPDC024068]|uniref:HAD hydrolase-like protein n=1 Tax=Nocardia sp. NPDC024068 TaxID=3157197 RepID=UPI0033E1CF25